MTYYGLWSTLAKTTFHSDCHLTQKSFRLFVVWSCLFLNVSRCGLGSGVVILQGDRLRPAWLVWDLNWEVLEKVYMGDAAFTRSRFHKMTGWHVAIIQRSYAKAVVHQELVYNRRKTLNWEIWLAFKVLFCHLQYDGEQNHLPSGFTSNL